MKKKTLSDTKYNYTTVIASCDKKKNDKNMLLPFFFFFSFICLSQGLKDLWTEDTTVSYFVVKRDFFEVDDRHAKPKSSFTDTVLFVRR